MHTKFKLFLIALLQLVVSAAMADTWTYTFKQGDLSTSSPVTLNNVSWTFSETGSTYLGWDGNSSKGIQIGSGSSAATAASLTTTGISGKITKVTVNASMASSGKAKLSISVGGTSYLSNQALTTSNAAYSGTGTSSGEIKISFSNTSKAFYIKSITVE